MSLNGGVGIKLCGLTLPEHAEAAAEAGAEFVGLVFAEQSRRRVTVEQARRIAAALPERREPPAQTLELIGAELWFGGCAAALDVLIGRGRPLVVGVFADQPVSLMNSIADAADLDLIQLGGNERWDTCLRLHRPAIKTLRAGAGARARDLLMMVEPGTASLCLLDADAPGQYGGTGTKADWQVATELAGSIPLMLAGGLTPENVAEAVATVRPWAVDVSSGIERDGVKDVALIRDFVAAARAAAVGTGSYAG